MKEFARVEKYGTGISSGVELFFGDKSILTHRENSGEIVKLANAAHRADLKVELKAFADKCVEEINWNEDREIVLSIDIDAFLDREEKK